MSGFCCPVCGEPLAEDAAGLHCDTGHCFDRSKYGYVNLLCSNVSSRKRHGDDALMVRARRDFLDAGGYACLRDALCALTEPLLAHGETLLDAGCGEGYYTAAVARSLGLRGKRVQLLGVDISKEALRYAAKRVCDAEFAVASLFSLPLADASVDCAMHLFAPNADAELLRVLRPGGRLLRAIPLEEHLFALKAAVYEHPYYNQVPDPDLPGFRLVAEHAIRQPLHLTEATQIVNLFQMTPYYYKTSRADQAKLAALNSFETPIAFGIRIYEKE